MYGKTFKDYVEEIDDLIIKVLMDLLYIGETAVTKTDFDFLQASIDIGRVFKKISVDESIYLFSMNDKAYEIYLQICKN